MGSNDPLLTLTFPSSLGGHLCSWGGSKKRCGFIYIYIMLPLVTSVRAFLPSDHPFIGVILDDISAMHERLGHAAATACAGRSRSTDCATPFPACVRGTRV